MKQKPWDRYEAALLLSYCLKIEAGDIPRKEAVDIVSNTLRKRAEVQGVEIDETLSMSDNRVFLYALYRFVEKCNLNREFNVSYLFDESIERDGVSPVRLFGLYDEEELRNVLLGLSARYPNFINATYTNDLQSISLRDKSSSDVLKLFEEEY